MFRAITDYIEAFRLLGLPQLRKYIFIPGIVSLILGIALFSLIGFFGDDLGVWLVSLFPNNWQSNFLNLIGKVVGYLLLVCFVFLLFRSILMLILGPILGPLSEKVELILNGQAASTSSSFRESVNQNVRSARLNVRIFFRELLWTICIGLCAFLPVIGLIISFTLLGVQAFYGGIGNLDFTLERHLNYKESLQFIKQFRFPIIGNGLVFIVLFMIPFVGLFIAPSLSVVAATITANRCLKQEGGASL